MCTQTELWQEQVNKKLKFEELNFTKSLSGIDLKFDEFKVPDCEVIKPKQSEKEPEASQPAALV